MSADLGTPASGLVRDGMSLTLGAVITSVTGVVSWMVTARLLPPDQVGASAAFVSGFLFLGGVCELGLGPAMLRWLPRAGVQRTMLLRRAYSAVVAAAVLGAVVFLAAAAPMWPALFVVAVIAWTLFQFQFNVLAGLRRTNWVLAETTAFGVGRLLVLVAAAPVLGALGVLLSWVIPALLAVLVVSWLVFRMSHDGPGALPDRAEVAGLVGPTYPTYVCVAALYHLVPLVVTYRSGPALGAVFFVVWMTPNALDLATTSFSSSLVVRLARQPVDVGQLTRLAGIRLAALFAPALLLGTLLAAPALRLFGPAYAQGATALQLVLLGYLARLVVVLAIAVHLGAGRGARVAVLQGGGAVSMVAVVLLAPAGNLVWIGVGYLVVQLLLAVIAAAALMRSR